MDASIIKAYVAAGMGDAVLQKMAFDAASDKDLRAVPVSAGSTSLNPRVNT
jgi:hypothetical protein